MPNQFVRIGEETHFALSYQQNAHIPSLEEYINLCRDLYEHVKTLSGGNVDMPSKSTEFHYFGVSGAPGGELLAPMIWSISHFPSFFAKLKQAVNSLVIGSPAELVLASTSSQNVYTVSHPSIHLLNKVRPNLVLSNVKTLSWSQLQTSLPQLDFAQIVINYVADDNVLNSVLNSMSQGGLLIISNSSNGGELYGDYGETSFPHQLHEQIKSTNNFDVMHMQGYISYTLCIRR